jgi:hypothetical protein
LSLNANYILDFSKTEKEELLEANIEAFNGKYEKLVKILDKAITVNRWRRITGPLALRRPLGGSGVPFA